MKKDDIYRLDSQLIDLLLIDHSTKNNLIWATDNYSFKGKGYQFNDCISTYSIIKHSGSAIKTRVAKSKKEQSERVKSKAEVFTPSWICNVQNNLIDNNWFGRENVFNTEVEKGWKTNSEKIIFPNNKTWQDYVKENRLEVTCGEAPYIVSRYDAVTGEEIPVNERIGLLDRKLRIINENIDDEIEWIEWAKTAFKSVYGYDWQGDNVFLARENLLYTFIDYYMQKFNKIPSKECLVEIAKIVSWNIWQMDGLKCVIPNSCKKFIETRYTLFGEEQYKVECEGCKTNNPNKHNGIYCYIMDWSINKRVKFVNLIKE